MIVYGVRLYGKDNVRVRFDPCPSCGALGKLSSFDAAKFFHIYWIPLIPLGRKRVMDSCPSCKMHRELGLREYRKVKRETLDGTVQAMKDNPRDPDAAAEAINAYVHFGELDNFEAMAPALANRHQQNAKVQSVVGGAYEYLGRYDEAETYYQRALHADPSPEHHEELATLLIREGKPEEAEAHLEHVTAQPTQENVGYLYFLNQAYRHHGRHEDALRILDRIEAGMPAAKDDPEHQTLRTSSEAARPSATPLRSQALSAPGGVKEEKSAVPSWAPGLVPLGIVVALVGWYLFSAFNAGHARPMYLVNGMASAYEVVVNDQTYSMGPYERKAVTFPEGELNMEFKGTTIPVEPQKVRYTTSFWSRPFTSQTVVLNPDRQAIVVEETTVYSANPNPDEVNDFSIYCGKALYSFDHVHYEFREFPEEIQTSSDSSRTRRTRVFQYRPETGDEGLQQMVENADPSQYVSLLKQRVSLQPDDLNSLAYYYSLSAAQDVEATIAFFQNGVSQRPILVDWHRLYQDSLDRFRPEHNVVAEYRALLNAEPENNTLKYLLGRIVADPSEAEILYMASEKGDSPTGMGYNAVAYRELCSGNFERALLFARQAVAANSERLPFVEQFATCLLANGELQELLDRLHGQTDAGSFSAAAALKEMKYLAMMGQLEDAKSVLEDAMKEIKAVSLEEQAQRARTALEFSLHYIQGDLQAYGEALATLELDEAAFQIAIHDQDLAAATEYLSATENQNHLLYLLAYCLAMEQGDADLAAPLLQQAADLLAATGEEGRTAAELLRQGDAQRIRDTLGSLALMPEGKRIVALSLGFAQPAVREVCFDVAKLHNFDPVFPYHTINRLMDPASSL